MNSDNQAIVKPPGGTFSKKTGKVTIMVPALNDLNLYLKAFNISGKSKTNLFMSGHYYTDSYGGISIIGPFIGAPFAVMLLETLITWGAEKIFFSGWCGSIDQKIRTGDIIIPEGSFIDEGSSVNYQTGSLDKFVTSSSPLTRILKEALCNHENVHTGPLWTTDSIFRETPDKVKKYQEYGALGVEMELSALLSVSHYHQIEMASVQVVSDELFTYKWNPGFKSGKFKKSREIVIDKMAHLCRILS